MSNFLPACFLACSAFADVTAVVDVLELEMTSITPPPYRDKSHVRRTYFHTKIYLHTKVRQLRVADDGEALGVSVLWGMAKRSMSLLQPNSLPTKRSSLRMISSTKLNHDEGHKVHISAPNITRFWPDAPHR